MQIKKGQKFKARREGLPDVKRVVPFDEEMFPLQVVTDNFQYDRLQVESRVVVYEVWAHGIPKTIAEVKHLHRGYVCYYNSYGDIKTREFMNMTHEQSFYAFCKFVEQCQNDLKLMVIAK